MKMKFKTINYLRVANAFINIINYSLRGFFFILGARYLSIHDLGMLGVIFSYNSIFVFFLGFEYWYFFNRKYAEYIAFAKFNDFKVFFLNQFYFYILVYLIFLPIIFFFFELRFKLGLVLCIGVISFHLIQEISRIWIYLNRQILSSLTTLSLAIWTIPVYILWLNGRLISLQNIVYIYVSSLFFCMLFWMSILIKVINLNPLEILKFREFFRFSIHKKAIKLSFWILLSVLCYRIVELSPRLFADFLRNYELAGAITFYQSFGSLITSFVYHIVSVFFLPKMLRKVDYNEFKTVIKELKFELIKYSFLFFIVSAVSPFVFVKIFNLKQEYVDFWYLSFVFAFAYFVLSLSTYYSYVSYVRNLDEVNYLSNILSFIFVFLTYVIMYLLKINVIIIITIAFFIFSFSQYLFKSLFYRRYESNESSLF